MFRFLSKKLNEMRWRRKSSRCLERPPITGKKAITMALGQKYSWCTWEITEKELRLDRTEQERSRRWQWICREKTLDEMQSRWRILSKIRTWFDQVWKNSSLCSVENILQKEQGWKQGNQIEIIAIISERVDNALDQGESHDWGLDSGYILKIHSIVFSYFLDMENENEESWFLWGIFGFNNWNCGVCIESRNTTGGESLEGSKDWFSAL